MASEEDVTLETLLNKATNPANRDEDWEAIMAFCDLVNKELEGPSIAVRLLGHKIQSPQERESLYSLATLEACVKNCGKRFHQEIGKFRFLNEIIKVVSPKYLGNHTTEKVKTRCVEILYSWSQCLKHEPKIGEAYQMLKKQGIVKTDPTHTDKTFEAPPPDRPKNKNSIFEDDDKSKLLARLLKSSHPEDLQAANRLIKNMVKQDAERIEKQSKRVTELETVQNNVKLLTEMLEHFSPQTTSSSEKDLMKELYENLEKQRPALFRLASDTDEKDTDGINAILAANDEVLKVMTQYKKTVEGEDNGLLLDTSTPGSKGKADADLVDLEFNGSCPKGSVSASKPAPTSSSILDDQLVGLDSMLLHDIDFGNFTPSFGSGDAAAKAASAAPKSDLDALGDIFGAASKPAATNINPLDTDLFALNTSSGGAGAAGGLGAFGSSPGNSIGFSAFISSGQSATPPPTQASAASLVTTSTGLLPSSGSLFTSSDLPGTGTPTTMTPTHTATPVLQPMSMGLAGQPSPEVVTGILSGTAPLQPVSVNSTATPKPAPAPKASGLEDLDALGQSLLQSSLPPNFKPTPAPGNRVPMNQMATTTPAATTLLDGLSQQVPAIKALAQGSPIATPTGSAHASPKHMPQVKQGTCEVQSLSDVFVPLESVKPGSVGPLSAYDKDGLKIVIHFGKDSPRPDVLVMVVSTMSTNTQAVKNISFQAAVPKTMRVKLQPPSATDLPAYNPILPPAAITQVMLIANPNKVKIRLKFKITYTIDDINQSGVGEVDTFPVQ